MNIIIERTIELNAPLLTEPLPGSLFTTEAKAHQFLIACTQNGAPVTLSGTVSAKFIREANNTTILMSGSISGGKASLILPADCYNISGRFDLTIFVTSNNVTTCIYSATGSVKAAQDGTLVDEGTVVPSIEQLQQDVTNLQNNKVNRAGDTMTGELKAPAFVVSNTDVAFVRNGVRDSLIRVPTDTNKFNFYQWKPGNTSVFDMYTLPPVTRESGSGQYDILTSKSPVTVAQGGTGATTQAGAMGVMGLLCDSGNKTTFEFANLSLLSNTGKFKYGILFGGDQASPYVYFVFVNVDNTSVVFTRILGSETSILFTGSVSGNTLTITGNNIVYGGVRLLWLNY